MPRLAAVAALGLLAAACTGPSGSTTTTSAVVPSSSEAATTTTAVAPVGGPVDLAGLPGRLVVIKPDGNLATMRPDGSDERALTEDAGGRYTISQPTWSPAGDRLAWTEVDGREGEPQAALVTAAVDGSARTRAGTELPVFYMYWDPAGERLAYLHAGTPALAMGIVDVAGGGATAEQVDSGQPYYFAWSPDGAELLVHVGADRLERFDPGSGEGVELGDAPGTFQAPGWGADGSMVYAVASGDGQRLVHRDRGGATRDLLRFDGFIWFLASPDGSEVAFQVLAGGEPDAVTAAYQRDDAPEAPVGALGVIDVDGGEVTTLAVETTISFFWSPSGTLVSLHPDGERSGWFRWRVWGTEPVTGPPYRPNATMVREYLPFFDQYAHSLTLWSPDGRAFAYAGSHDGGGDGIWVQPVDGSDPVRVADGRFAAWSWR